MSVPTDHIKGLVKTPAESSEKSADSAQSPAPAQIDPAPAQVAALKLSKEVPGPVAPATNNSASHLMDPATTGKLKKIVPSDKQQQPVTHEVLGGVESANIVPAAVTEDEQPQSHSVTGNADDLSLDQSKSHERPTSYAAPKMPLKSGWDKTKDIGAYSGYLIQGAQRSLNSGVSALEMDQVDQPFWKAWKEPDLDAEDITPPALLTNMSTAVSASGDVAQPLKMLEYVAASKKAAGELGERRQANRVIAKYNRLKAELANPDISDEEARQKQAALDQLKAKRILAQKTLDKGGWELASGQAKAYIGFGKYLYGTGLATEHAIVTGVRVARSGNGVHAAFTGAVETTSTTGFQIAGAAIGTVFNPVNATYYSIQAHKDKKKLAKTHAMNERATAAVADFRNDPTLRSVAQRVERKTDMEVHNIRFKRATNISRATISSIGAVGSAFTLLHVAGVATAIVAGGAAIAAAWPVIAGLAAAAALATAAYGIYQYARHRSSSAEKQSMTSAYGEIRQCSFDQNAFNAKGKLKTDHPLYQSKAIKKLFDVLAKDGNDINVLRSKFNSRSLTRHDLARLSELAMLGHIRRDSNAAAYVLLQRLVAESEPDQASASGNSAIELLRALGVGQDKIDAIQATGCQALYTMNEIDPDSADAQQQIEEAKSQLRDAMKLLMKELQLR